jgi:hypothetical protein
MTPEFVASEILLAFQLESKLFVKHRYHPRLVDPTQQSLPNTLDLVDLLVMRRSILSLVFFVVLVSTTNSDNHLKG